MLLGSARRRFSAIASSSQVTSRAAIIVALTPMSMRLECTEWPRTVVNQDTEPLWPVTTLHPGRLAHDHGGWSRDDAAAISSTRNGAPWQPDFLVIGQGEMDRPSQSSLQHPRHGGERKRVETLHVAGAASVEPAIPFRQDERIARPCLALHRHDVGMAGEDDPAFHRRAHCGVEVGLGPVWARHQCGFRCRDSPR